jgi:hypothetical protein
VDCDQSFEQMIAAGDYDWISSDVTGVQFTIAGRGLVKAEMLIFLADDRADSAEVVKRIRRYYTNNPWEPARIEHLLAYGAMLPEKQRTGFTIVALGSAGWLRGRAIVPCLCRTGKFRDLNYDWMDNGGWWESRRRSPRGYLAVRRSCYGRTDPSTGSG